MRLLSMLRVSIAVLLAAATAAFAASADGDSLASFPSATSSAFDPRPAALLDISKLRRAEIDSLKASVGAGWWLEMGDTLLVAGDLSKAFSAVPADGLRELGSITPDDLILHARGCSDTSLAPTLALVPGLSYELMRNTPSTRTAPRMHADHLGAPQWLAVEPNTVLAQRFELPEGVAPSPDPNIAPIVATVDADRWFAGVASLAAFDRSSFSAELPAARAYIAQEFAALGLEVSEPEFRFTFNQQTANVRNVIGRWPGTRNSGDWIVVGGHYDSRNSVNGAPADTPGADDNASGCSGVMEAARALIRFRPESTMLFMCYAGEEQGLRGSLAHVNALSAAGDLSRVSHMANMDMIGWSRDLDFSVLLETTNVTANVAIMQELAIAASTYAPELTVITGTNPCCSDHMPYINAGRPGVLSIHRDTSTGGTASPYPHYHRATDLPENLGPHSRAIGGAIIRSNVAALAQWSGASDLVFRDTFSD